MSWLEIWASAFTVICIVLAGRNSIHTWWTGIVACVLFGELFMQSQLYADVTLQVFFIVTSVWGWVTWMTHSGNIPERPITSISTVPVWKLALIGIAAIGVSMGYATILHLYTNAYLPYVDATVMVLSIMGQILLMRREIETWIVWIAVNTLSVPLYWSKELYVTSGLYACFLVNAIISYFYWKKLMEEQHHVTSA